MFLIQVPNSPHIFKRYNMQGPPARVVQMIFCSPTWAHAAIQTARSTIVGECWWDCLNLLYADWKHPKLEPLLGLTPLLSLLSLGLFGALSRIYIWVRHGQIWWYWACNRVNTMLDVHNSLISGIEWPAQIENPCRVPRIKITIQAPACPKEVCMIYCTHTGDIQFQSFLYMQDDAGI